MAKKGIILVEEVGYKPLTKKNKRKVVGEETNENKEKQKKENDRR